MKKFLLLFLSMVLITSVFAQKDVIKKGNPVKSDLSKIKVLDRKVIMNAKDFFVPVGIPIGMTNYDLQTNAASTNRLIARADGTVSAVWIQYQGTGVPAAPERGSGYNYFNGTSWDFTSMAGNETVEGTTRVGWPSIIDDGSNELVLAHIMETPGIYGHTQTIGAAGSDWTQANVTGGPEGMLWPRAVSAGDNFYAIGVDDYVVAQTEVEALHFYYSDDAGSTWAYMGKMPNYNSYYHHGQGDTYAMDARDNYVAVVNFATFGDVVLWKSDDYGSNWTETIINDFPVDVYNTAGGVIIDMDTDGTADTIMSSDNTGDVIIDSNGKVHLTFSRMRYLDEDGLGDDYNYFPYYDWCLYWNEDMGPGSFAGVESPSSIDLNVSAEVDTIGWSPDLNGNGVLDFVEVASGEFPFGTYGSSLSAYSNLAIDAGDTLYVIFSTVMEGDDYLKTDAVPNAQQYRAVFVTKRDPVTGVWTDPIDVTSNDGTNAENAFPELAKYVDRDLHMYVQWDNEPGCRLDELTDPITDNFIVYKKINLDGSNSIDNINTIDVSVYPNPATDIVNIVADNINSIEVYNVIGARIMLINNNFNNINVSALSSGSYVFKITTNEGVVVKKIQIN